MAKKKKEEVTEVVEETTQEITEQVEETKKPNINEDGDYVVDLSKPIENEIKEDNADDSGVVAESKDADAPQEQKEIQPEAKTQETPVVEEITEEEVEEQVEEITEKAEEAIKENLETGKPLPENIQKLMDFMEDTGGDLNDYVRLNQDYSSLNDVTLLKEYYNQTKPHLTADEIDFLMEDQFSYDDDVDEERDIKRKKLAMKEQVAQAKQHLDGAKSKYYEDIKAGSKLTTEQQKAIDFFNRYNKESEKNTKAKERSQSIFTQKTKEVFNDKFKGFEYNVGDKKFRYNVNDVDSIKQTQSDVSNFVKKFLNKNNEIEDAKGYHKSMFTAMNPDAIANHFYEQGRTDALKQSIEKSKNVDMNPRQNHGTVEAGGVKVRVLGDDSSDFKFKIKNNKFKN